MTSTIQKLLGLTVIVVLQASCRQDVAHPIPKRGDGSETFKFNPDKKYAPAHPKTPKEEREKSKSETK